MAMARSSLAVALAILAASALLSMRVPGAEDTQLDPDQAVGDPNHDGLVAPQSDDAAELSAETKEAEANFCDDPDAERTSRCVSFVRRQRALCEGWNNEWIEKMLHPGRRQPFWDKGHEEIHKCHVSWEAGFPEQNCSFDNPEFFKLGDSTMVTLPKPALCLHSKSLFAFQVIKRATNKVLISFGSGGVCPDYTTMATGLCCDKNIAAPQHGIFNHESKHDNPFRDFTVIHITPCSGDFGIGRVTHNFKLKSYPKETVQQRGEVNIKLALEWARKNLGDHRLVDELVIYGHGDGAWAALSWMDEMLMGHSFKWKSAKVIVDGGMGLMPKGGAVEMINQFHSCNSGLYKDGLLWLCQQGMLTFPDMMDHHMHKYPKVEFFSIESKADTHQMEFYNMVEHWMSKRKKRYLDLFMIKPEAYLKELNEAYMLIHKHNRNVAHFLINGNSHGLLVTGDLWLAHENGPMGKKPDDATYLIDWLNQGASIDCVTLKNMCYGKRIHYQDAQASDGYMYCDPWFDTVHMIYNCEGAEPDPIPEPYVPTTTIETTTTDPFEIPEWLYPTGTTTTSTTVTTTITETTSTTSTTYNGTTTFTTSTSTWTTKSTTWDHSGWIPPPGVSAD